MKRKCFCGADRLAGIAAKSRYDLPFWAESTIAAGVCEIGWQSCGEDEETAVSAASDYPLSV